MQQPFDDDWDDLDDFEIEQCVIKENEILSQNPDLLQKTFTQQINVSKEIKDHWVNGKFNSFTDEISIPKSEFSNSGKGIQFNDQKNNGSGTFSKPYAPVPKKQSFYKPLPVGPSTSFNSNDCFIKEKKFDHETELKSLKNQLEQVLKEKAKLEEENLVKQGEVCNLRYELKRKETSLETERVDQCIALEAAEKRGKEKASKTITELELKVKSLERNLDRLEGNLLFKNREVDELLAKCKQSENQKAPSTSALNGTRATTHYSPSPKKRKLEDRFSPNKTHNFADKFDFGDKKKVVKSVQVQTEQEVNPQTRPPIKISTRKGRINGSRKAFYLLNNSKHAVIQFPSTIKGATDKEYTFLSQMISSEVHQADSSEHLLVKHACSSLENLLKATQNENPSVGRIVSRHDKKSENVFMISSLPLLKILSVAKSGNENVGQNCVKILALCIDCFLMNNDENISGIVSSLESLSFSIKQCSDIPLELCNTVVETMKRCCDLASFDVVPMLISSLNWLNTFEIFRRKSCVNITGQCLLKKFCALLKKTKKQASPKKVCDDLVIFISQFLQDEPNTLFMNNVCQCSTFLLTTFVNNLYLASRLAHKDAEWQYVFKGLKILHTWQKKDKSWLEKVSQSNTYSLLISTIIKEAKLLRAKGVLDQHVWELIYEIYEIDEPPS